MYLFVILDDKRPSCLCAALMLSDFKNASVPETLHANPSVNKPMVHLYMQGSGLLQCFVFWQILGLRP